jgi:hypothetical protein
MFSEIFDRHHRELYRYLRHRVGPNSLPTWPRRPSSSPLAGAVH